MRSKRKEVTRRLSGRRYDFQSANLRLPDLVLDLSSIFALLLRAWFVEI